ncbi:GIY-YIG nuclease family protein [Bacillus marinisedimentorum]|uniref:GIY-YIG nuclease family protein n=1 Tax=Bacillus marinisedimentorum TaxID=1821260 RepID=UPI000871C770|nr:GIY-YIG nuclease family protein [Bacillus marinisedimentorum]
MLTEDELNWIKDVLSDSEPYEISPSYFYKKQTEFVRNSNKETVRKELDELRKKIQLTPQKLLGVRYKSQQENQNIDNFSGIYVIHNLSKDSYYVGQAKAVFDRAYKHFVKSAGNTEVYMDYRLGNEFNISLIPIEYTSFSSLNELEDNAIRAYDSYQNGYNRMPGNILDKHIFESEDYQKAADLILGAVKEEILLDLTNTRKRMKYVKELFLELGLPHNIHFTIGFVRVIKEYQKEVKKG